MGGDNGSIGSGTVFWTIGVGDSMKGIGRTCWIEFESQVAVGKKVDCSTKVTWALIPCWKWALSLIQPHKTNL